MSTGEAQIEPARSHWNFRLMVFDGEFGPWLSMREVYYDDQGRPEMYTADPIGVTGDTLEDVQTALARMAEALAKPILSSDDFPKVPRD